MIYKTNTLITVKIGKRNLQLTFIRNFRRRTSCYCRVSAYCSEHSITKIGFHRRLIK